MTSPRALTVRLACIIMPCSFLPLSSCTPSGTPESPEQKPALVVGDPEPSESPVPVEATEPGDGPVIARPIDDGPSLGNSKERPPRSKALVRVELQNLESLLQATPSNSPDRPTLLDRMVDTYTELAVTEKGEGDEPAARQALSDAVRHYQDLRASYPQHASLDAVSFALGDAQLALGERAAARKTFFEIVQDYPKSKLIPDIYVRFGDMFFEDAASDPAKWPLAKAAYEQALKYPAPSNRSFGYAHYKLGWVNRNVGDDTKALSHFVDAIQASEAHPQGQGARVLARGARKDLVQVYAAVGRPQRAFAFFQRVGGPTGSRDQTAARMVLQLARAYADNGQLAESTAAYREALKRDPGEACRQLRGDLPHMKSTANPATTAAVRKLEASYTKSCKGR